MSISSKIAIIIILGAIAIAHAEGVGGGIGGAEGIGNGIGDPSGIGGFKINSSSPPPSCSGALDLSQGCIIPGLG